MLLSHFFPILLLAPCLAYNQTIGLSLAYLEKAVYCGADAFEKWEAAGDVPKKGVDLRMLLKMFHSSPCEARGGQIYLDHESRKLQSGLKRSFS